MASKTRTRADVAAEADGTGPGAVTLEGAATVTVQEGDTIDSIAAAHGVSADALFQANRGSLGSNAERNLHPGLRLDVPPAD